MAPVPKARAEEDLPKPLLEAWLDSDDGEGIPRTGRARHYIDAAAVLSSFDPAQIAPTGTTRHDPVAVSSLLQFSRPIHAAGKRVHWQLDDKARRVALLRLGTRVRLRAARAANSTSDIDPVQRGIDLMLKSDDLSIDRMTLPDLLGLQRAARWFEGVRGVHPPDPAELETRIQRERVLQPMRALVAEGFVGRERELSVLNDYVGVLPPERAWHYLRRGIRHVAYLMDMRPPLFLCGPGGIGKSTLLAQFVLKHTNGNLDHPLPFVYLDFDRASLNPKIPDTLLAEGVRQIGLEFPKLGFRDLQEAAQERLRLSGEVDYSASAQFERSAHLVEAFSRLLADLSRENGQPVLFVLDTFEEAQTHGPSAIKAIWQLLRELLERVDQLRVIVAGRAPLSGAYPHESVELETLEVEQAIAFLRRRSKATFGRTISDRDAHAIFDVLKIREAGGKLGAVPLSLALAARVVAREGLDALKETIPRRRLFSLITAEQQQGLLNTRILQHLNSSEPELRKIADPGLLLRRITPEIIIKVLAGPCGLAANTRQDAEDLFAKLTKEIALVDAEKEPGAVWHRASVRRVMLPALRHRVSQDLAAAIHKNAVEYYQAHNTDIARTEEIYHRLFLGQDREQLDRRWRKGLESGLRGIVEEIDGGARLWLAGKLELEVDDALRLQADLVDWERQTELRVRTLLEAGLIDEALAALRERSERSAASPLPVLEADALLLLGRVKEAERVVSGALDHVGSSGRDDVGAPLLMRLATIAERTGDYARALESASEALRLARRAADRMSVLGAGAACLRLNGLVGSAGSTEHQRLQKELTELLADRGFRQQLRKRPALLRAVAAQLGTPDVLADAFEVLGVDRKALGTILESVHSAVKRSTGGRGRLFATIDRLARRESGVSTAGIGHELAGLIRKGVDADLLRTLTRSFSGSVEAGVRQVIASTDSIQVPLPEDTKLLVEEIRSTFDFSSLEECVYLTTDYRLGAIVRTEQPFHRQVVELLAYLAGAGALERFLVGLIHWAGSTPRLRSIAAELQRALSRA